jgi:hypothetical protein
VFGHFHNAPIERREDYLKERITDKHILISLEDTKYKMVLLDRVWLGKIENDRVKSLLASKK